jgi:triacylglycerol lipase
MAQGPKPIPRRLRDWRYLRPPCRQYAYFAAGEPFQARGGNCPAINATWLADAALLAYGEPHWTLPIFRQAGFADVRFLGAEGTHAYLGRLGTAIILAFRGTQIDDPWEFVQDLQTDLSIAPVAADGYPGRVHGGFRRALEAIRPALQAALAQIGDGPLWLTGHSLGGALATLAGRELRAAGVCTFAAPRVGDQDFANTLEGLHLVRYVMAADLVPRLPPRRLGFTHAGLRRVIDARGVIAERPEPRRLYEGRSVEQILADWTSAARLNLFDHSPVLYATHVYNAWTREGPHA